MQRRPIRQTAWPSESRSRSLLSGRICSKNPFAWPAPVVAQCAFRGLGTRITPQELTATGVLKAVDQAAHALDDGRQQIASGEYTFGIRRYVKGSGSFSLKQLPEYKLSGVKPIQNGASNHPMTQNTIETAQLKLLQDSGAVQTVRVRGVPGGWVLSAQVGMTERVLRLKASANPRVFANLETVGDYLQRAGVRHFTVDMAGHTKTALL